ncbi:FAD-dependent cmnm(5)s(2)U34 oxidoreductase, partial [Caulobacter sp. B11]
RERERFAAVAAQGIFAPSAMSLAAEDQVAERLSEPGLPALAMGQALVIEPALILEAWAPRREPRAVARLAHTALGWDLLDDQGEVMATAEVVILAGGADLDRLWPQAPLRLVRGQASWTQAAAPPPVAFGGYAIPTRDGVLFGATMIATIARPTPGGRPRAQPDEPGHGPARPGRSAAGAGSGRTGRHPGDHGAITCLWPDACRTRPTACSCSAVWAGAASASRRASGRACGGPGGGPASPLPRDLSRLVDPARFNSLNRRVGV